MAVTFKDPKNVHLGGPMVRVNDLACSGEITPGMLLERAGGVYQVHTADLHGPVTLALNVPELNKTIDDVYADGDLMFAGIFQAGSTGLAWLASGQNVADGARLESAGAGKFKVLDNGVALARAIEAKDATAGDARIRIEAI